MSLQSICYEVIDDEKSTLKIIDQTLLPFRTIHLEIVTAEDAWNAIHSMKIRGAPANGVLSCLIIALQIRAAEFSSYDDILVFLEEKFSYLCSARPTGVNTLEAKDRFLALAKKLVNDKLPLQDIKRQICLSLEKTLTEDISLNKSIGEHGANHIISTCSKDEIDKKFTVLTHCNTGSLATAGYGTALGVVRTLHSRGQLNHCYFTETRPFNQGSRLTSYELRTDNIASTMICDNMVAHLMKSKTIDAVVTGADNIVANGDAANKIGTYQIAVIAKYHSVPFYVAAPSTSCRLQIQTGDEISVEQRPEDEMKQIRGVETTHPDTRCWNPAFDVTPASLITGGIITEFGVFKPSDFANKMADYIKKRDCSLFS